MGSFGGFYKGDKKKSKKDKQGKVECRELLLFLPCQN
jgi:hypothetical protein